MIEAPVKVYESALTPEQCRYIESLMMQKGPSKAGHPKEWLVSSIINAIMYIARPGCQWRILPVSFPPWQTVYYHYNKWCKNHMWQKINDALTKMDRTRCSRESAPSASIIDSQSVKTTEVGGQNGRKGHMLADVEGRIIGAIVHEGNIQDRDGAKILLEKLKDKYPRLKLIWVDGAYSGKLIQWAEKNTGLDLEIVKSQFNRFRRLSKYFEHLFVLSESLMYIVMISIMIRRLIP